VTAFAAECQQALAALRLRDRHFPAAARASLARRCHTGPGAWLGAAGQLGYDALAAAMPHPAYPACQCRLGFSDEDSLRYAPEYLPEFELSWVAVNRAALVRAGGARPRWWPDLPDVGLPGSLTATHDLLPVHPLTARRRLAAALAEAGLTCAGPAPAQPARAGRAGAAAAVTAPASYLRVTPTLSTRTLAVTADPGAHLKLPLPISTLGLRNRRSIAPGTLADGALVQQILATAAAGDGTLSRLLLADDSTYAHAGHRYLGYLLRRFPEGLDGCHVVPVAALLAPAVPAGETAGGGRLVIETLARAGAGGSLSALLDAYFGVLFGIQVRLFARYGIALESHQQNAAVVLGPFPGARHVSGAAPPEAAGGAARPQLRLLVKDFDGALINHSRLRSALGSAAPGRGSFADSRLLTGSDDALADVFITITVHLCAGALAFGLADRGLAPLPELLALIRRNLRAALDQHAGFPAAGLLRARILEADRLPGKSMVTAGTLLDKSRTGARDINKYYGTTGPNYLRDPR
jgi:siderophore synthetase component